MEKVKFELNGKQVEASLEQNQTLLWALRTQFNLTGTKYGCGEGYCGSCTVLINDEPARSCVTPLEDVDGAKVVTIEGLADGEKLHPVQQAFVENDALQCGYCTPGMILNAVSLLKNNPEPTRKEIIDGMDGNLCRCGAHTRIIRAIESASKMMKGEPKR
ncbi:MAG: (2Fe-2S)-binding protein [Bacteroidetes bacterium]|nr:MAG: (2Fe-2S)-binding protein [Bacteroidota bacterium]